MLNKVLKTQKKCCQTPRTLENNIQTPETVKGLDFNDLKSFLESRPHGATGSLSVGWTPPPSVKMDKIRQNLKSCRSHMFGWEKYLIIIKYFP